MTSKVRGGVAGPVGSGKTALLAILCKKLKDNFEIAVVTNDIYTQEDADFLIKKDILEKGRIVGVETGGCPHTAIREDCSLNKNAVIELEKKYHPLDFIFVESGGDNLAASFSPELVDICIYVIDVSAGDKIPRKGGPGITRSDLLIINKIDLSKMVGANLEIMKNDTNKMRGSMPWFFTNLKNSEGVDLVIDYLLNQIPK